MRLQDQLDGITQQTRTLVQAERLAVSEAAVSELFSSGIEERVLGLGAVAPTFELTDAGSGKRVALSDVLALGPVILKFFRGRWCPYCVTELERWRDLYAEVRRAGAFLLAISPQTMRQNGFTVEQHALPFPVLSDPGTEVAASYGLAYTVPQPHRGYFRSILVNIPFANAGLTYDTATESSWRLPLPGTFVVRQDRTVVFAEAHADFHVRPEPEDVLAALPMLRGTK